MAAPTLIRRELKNAKAYYIPAGELVDAVTTSRTTWPDNDPTTNYTAYEIPDIEGLIQEILSEDEDFLMPQDSGGYQNEPEKQLRMLAWTLTTAKTSSYVKQLQFALAAAAVAATAQAPGVKGQLSLDGVLLIEIRGNDGAIIERWQIWARMTLADPGPAAAPQTSRVQLRFSKLQSGNNTYVALAA